jgi:hypothetical protein
MAKTIDEGFEELRFNLEITDLQEKTVSTRQKNVRKALEDDFDILDSFLTGSYRRSTMIAPLKGADLDIFIVLDPKYYEASGQAALLANVKKELRKTYTETPDISPNGQAVTIRFTDFKVDVITGFRRKGVRIDDYRHMNHILTLQNAEPQLRLLRARRYTYLIGKRRFGQPDGPLRDEVAEPARQPCRSLRSAWPVDRSGAPAATAEEDSVA